MLPVSQDYLYLSSVSVSDEVIYFVDFLLLHAEVDLILIKFLLRGRVCSVPAFAEGLYH